MRTLASQLLAGRNSGPVALLCLAISVFAAQAPAQGRRAPAADVEGVFSSFAVLPESGDLGGLKVIILSGQAEGDTQYYAVVQFAEGLPEEPLMVKAKVAGTNVSFTTGEGENAIRFSGTVTAPGLRLKWTGAGGTESGFLKRQSCK